MRRKVTILALVCALLVFPAVVSGQGGPDGTADYALNLRAGPGTGFDVIAILPPGTGMVFEARGTDLGWLLGHTGDGAARGWVAALYLSYRDGFVAASLPLSDEVIAAPPPSVAPASSGSPEVSAGPAEVPAGPVASLPLVAMGSRIGEIFARGQALGNHPAVFTQVGECNTMSQAFMTAFGTGQYDLGAYASLQATIDFFNTVSPVEGVSSSFWYKGVAMSTGLTSLAVIDPAYADPARCPAGVSMLECEYDRVHPAVALIHLGLYDVYWLNPAQYESAMRRIVEISIDRGVIPVLTTIPTCPGDTANWPNEASVRVENRAAFNTILAALAREYGVPLINLWRGTQSLSNCGLLPGDYQHLSGEYATGTWGMFNGPEQQYGFTQWNLLALQALDALRQAVLAGG